MKEKFINFLVSHHALDEYEQEILPYSFSDLKAQMEDGGHIFLLCDGCIFFWRQATTEVNWEQLNEKWQKCLKEK